MNEINIERFSKGIPALLIILSVFLSVLTIAQVISIVKDNRVADYSKTITVSGEGEVFAVPDVARISFSVLEENIDQAVAQQKVSERMTSILSLLEIDEKDIKTVQYLITPRYEYGKNSFEMYRGDSRKLVGYEVQQTTEITVRDMTQTGAIVGLLGEQKVSNMYGPNFEIDDPSLLEIEAKKIAIQKAKEKAEILTKELGMRLGRVLDFQENGGYYPMMRMGYEDTAVMEASLTKAQSAPILPEGENRISANVSITYKIK